MNTTKSKSNFDGFLISILLLAFLYNSYRYIFQINSSETSPTYSDTPIWLSLGKYAIYFCLFIYFGFLAFTIRNKSVSYGKDVLVSSVRKKDILVKNTLFFSLYTYLLILPVLYSVSLKNLHFLELGFFFSFPIAVQLFFHGRKTSIFSNSWLWIFMIRVALIYGFVQILLFFTVHRLPALAYANTISIRFGSFLDDPNGFSIFSSFLIGFSYVYFQKTSKFIYCSLLLVLLFATQSVTGIGSIFLSILTIYLLSFFVNPKVSKTIQRLYIGFLTILLTLSLFLLNQESVLNFYNEFVYFKAESAAAHLSFISFLHEVNFLTLIGLSPLDEHFESEFVTILINFGVIYLFLLFYLYFISVKNFYFMSLNKNLSLEKRAFISGALLYLLTCFFSEFNLPVLQIFPLNLFAIFLFTSITSNMLKT